MATSNQSTTIASVQELSAVSTMTLQPGPDSSSTAAIPSTDAPSSTVGSTEEMTSSSLSASPPTPTSLNEVVIATLEKAEEWHTVGANGKVVKTNGIATPTPDLEGRSHSKSKGQQVISQSDYHVSGGAYSSLSVEQAGSRKKKSKKGGNKKTQTASSTSEQIVAGDAESRGRQKTPMVLKNVDAPASTTISLADSAASNDTDKAAGNDADNGMDVGIVASTLVSNDTDDKSHGWLERIISFFGRPIEALWKAIAGTDKVEASSVPLVNEASGNLQYLVASDDWTGGLCI